MYDDLIAILTNGSDSEHDIELARFGIESAILGFISESNPTFTEVNSNLGLLEKQMRTLANTLKGFDSDIHNLGTLDLHAHIHENFKKVLGPRLGNEETKAACSDIVTQCQVFGPKVLALILETYRSSINYNLQKEHIKNLKGLNPEAKRLRVLIAKMAGLYEIFGGIDSSAEASRFVAAIRILFSIIDVDKDASSAIERAKEQTYYGDYKKTPSKHPSFEMYLFYKKNHPQNF